VRHERIRTRWFSLSLVDASIDDEVLFHSLAAEASCCANGLHHILRKSTQARPETRTFEARQVPGDHIDFDNLLVPRPNADSMPE
jgi:hypothetical protein